MYYLENEMLQPSNVHSFMLIFGKFYASEHLLCLQDFVKMQSTN